ncbi:hypothetical protein [Gimesia aquarii]|uniref:Uncharacterized protein n=1 Tax=Gimesia aquarii TaxID=2527964 RepID=A0A517X2F6_9PLAN|nr:hypothetical protein [Gimesia aquarii]QDU11669.1 hypothetical protein V202x_50930 [Gimesia aquarii]
MTPEKARETILIHSGCHPDLDSFPHWRNGFLGSLRPFKELNEKNLTEVITAITALPEFPSELIVIQSLWELSTRTRLWGLDPDGMLQRNNLLSPQDTELLLLWVRCTEQAVSKLLAGGNPNEALEYYKQNKPI